MFRCILFDRDGTLGVLDDVRFPETFHPFCDIRAAFQAFKDLGLIVGIITNQSSIARGTAKDYDYDAEFHSYGADIWRICPHDDADHCNCRKPKSGLLLSAAEALQIPLHEILVVGDRITDVECAANVGAYAALVRTGSGAKEEEKVKEKYPHLTIVNRFDDLIDILDMLD